MIKSSAAQTEIPPGALITFLQKGLEYIAIEEHIGEDGTITEFENSYTLLSPLICEAVAVKEDRRVRSSIPTSSSANNLAAVAAGMPTITSSSTATGGNGNSKETKDNHAHHKDSKDKDAMDVVPSEGTGKDGNSSSKNVPPSALQVMYVRHKDLFQMYFIFPYSSFVMFL